MSSRYLTHMKRLDARPIPDGGEEIRAFLVVRNETLRLPSTLRHHRALGVGRFFVLDNGSNDGTLDYLAGEPDVHVFSTSQRYSESNYGVDWTNDLLDAFGTGHWTLTIDADEQLIYPHYEDLDLPSLCRYLDQAGADAMPCLLLDMYADAAVQDTRHDPEAALLETCRYFDSAPYRTHGARDFPHFLIHGGVRHRIMKPIAERCPLITLSKVPLVKWTPGTKYLCSTHFLTAAKAAPIMGTLLHFKFLSDFHDRVQVEVARGEHFEEAGEYRAYLELFRDSGPVKLMCNRSERFKDSAQLTRLRLMETADSYEEFVKSAAADSARPANRKLAAAS